MVYKKSNESYYFLFIHTLLTNCMDNNEGPNTKLCFHFVFCLWLFTKGLINFKQDFLHGAL